MSIKVILMILWSLFALSNVCASEMPFPSILARDYQMIKLEDVDISLMELIKYGVAENGEARSVYYDKENNLFYKIWSANYSDSRNFVTAVKRNFYKDLAPLLGLLFDQNGHCRGYITLGLHEEVPLKLCTNRYGYLCLDVADNQSGNYQRFYRLLIEKCLALDLYYFDLVPSNLAIYQGNYCLIDLEVILTKNELKEMHNTSLNEWMIFLEYLPLDYDFFIQSITKTNGEIK